MPEGFDQISTSADQVLDRLRQDIVAGHLHPGARVTVAAISQRYGVSAMPVREALRRLEGEGILVNHPHRGVTVIAVDRAFIENTYAVREVLFGLVAASCARRATPADSAAILAAGEAHADACRAGAPAEAIVAADRVFHGLIATVAANPPAVRALALGRGPVEALRIRTGFGAGRLERIIAEHHGLAHAIADGDTSAADLYARLHVVAAREDLLAGLVI